MYLLHRKALADSSQKTRTLGLSVSDNFILMNITVDTTQAYDRQTDT